MTAPESRFRSPQGDTPAAQTETWSAGSTIFDASEGHGQVFLVRSGCIRLFKRFPDEREITIGLLGPNTVFTQEEAGVEGSTGIWAVAMVDSSVSSIPVEELAEVIVASPQLAASMITGMNRRITEVQSLVESMATTGVPQRLASMLLTLASRFGRPGAEEFVSIELAVSHQALANMIGAHRVTVSREIGKLHKRGLVRASGRNRLAVDVEGLRRFLQTNAGRPTRG